MSEHTVFTLIRQNFKFLIMASSTTNIIDSVVKEVGDIMSTRLSRVCADYALYKESHDAILAIPAVQRAIRDGPRFKQEPRDEEDEKAQSEASLAHIQSQLTQCFDVIENLQAELQMVKLENDALRLQLRRPQTETCIESPLSENITLVIEETESSTRVDDVEVQNEEADQNEQADQAEEEEADEEEDQDTVYEEEEEQEEQGEQNDGNEEEAEEEGEDEDEDQNTVEEEEEQEEQDEQEEQPDNEEEDDQPDNEDDEEEAEEANEAEEEDAEEDGQEEAEEPVQEEEEVEVVEIEIKGKMYFTTNETSGIIYECLADGDIGDEIGKFVKGKPVFNAKK